MPTELKPIRDSYANLSYGIYQPLVVRWVSSWTLGTLANVLALRARKGKDLKPDAVRPTAIALQTTRLGSRLPDPKDLPKSARPAASTPAQAAGSKPDTVGRPLPKDAAPITGLANFPDAIQLGTSIHLHGLLDNLPIGRATSIPTIFNGRVGGRGADADVSGKSAAAAAAMRQAVERALAGNKDLGRELSTAIRQVGLYELFPTSSVQEGLSPIGMINVFRQLYFNKEEGIGPIEQSFTVAPLETLEVAYEVIRRQTHEEVTEFGSEQVSETAIESKNIDEVSDKVSSMVQRDSSVAASADASGFLGVWQIGVTTDASFAQSSQLSREESTRRVKEVTKRAAERVTKTFSVRMRDVIDVTSTALTRRTIKNESPHPVSYGLRRVLRRVGVKVQELGPKLVWQLYMCDPGDGLARSRFVHFREAEPIAPTDVPPGLPPRPQGGVDTGTTDSALIFDVEKRIYYAMMVIRPGPDRVVTAVSIDEVADLEGGGTDDDSPAALNETQWNAHWDETTGTFTVNIGIDRGDSSSVSITYSYKWDPSPAVVAQWEAQRQQQIAELRDKALAEQFERQKQLITERSRIRSRPAADLRREERFEVMNRIVSQVFARRDDPSVPTPLEIEYFHRYFDIDGMFIYAHPSWWRPRYTPVGSSFERPAYEITAESEPAKFGSSLGWLMQLDGDTRRNEFINSPWVRVCLPIHPGREREAIQWLVRHVEGTLGFDQDQGSLAALLQSIEQLRAKQAALGMEGPDYVTIDSGVVQTGTNQTAPLTPAGVYPIIQEFDVVVPTDGFVYDELAISNP